MASKRIQRWLGVLTFCTAFIYLIHIFIPNVFLQRSYEIGAAMLFLITLIYARRSSKITGILLISIGSVMFILKGVHGWTILEGFGKNMNLLTLFIVVPLISVMISTGGYLTALKQKMISLQTKSDSGAHPYRLSAILTSGMGLLLNLGTMPIVYRIAEESFSPFYKKKMGIVLHRAFTFCMFWSPYFVNVGIMLVLFDISWSEISIAGIIIALGFLVITMIFFRWVHFDNDLLTDGNESMTEAEDEKVVHQKLKGLFTGGMILFLFSFLLEVWLEVSMLTIVSVLGLLYPLIWSMITRIVKEYLQAAIQYVSGAFDRLKNEMLIFISAGYIGVAIQQTEAGLWVSSMIDQLSLGSTYLMSILITFFVIFLAMIGIHPVIVVIGIGSSLHPEWFGVSPAYLAVNLLMAWGMATSLSPFSGSVLMTSGLIKASPFSVVKQNLPFIAVCFLILPILLWLMGITGLL